jgi:UPF0755 protein
MWPYLYKGKRQISSGPSLGSVKFRRRFIIVFPIVILVVVVAAYLSFRYLISPITSAVSSKTTFVIFPSDSGDEIVNKLFSNKLIRSTIVAKLYLKWTGLDTRLRPGSYLLSPSQDLKTIMDVLTTGPSDIWITLPEGWRREQIAARLDNLLEGPTKVFSADEFLVETVSLEGQLFPDTYLVPKEVSTSQMIAILTKNFSKKSSLSLPSDQATLTLASLLEREARSDADRQLIAGILLKRLEAGWPLQIDATIQYATDTINCQKTPITCKYWSPISHTKLPSAYNTYLHNGLPPGPIASPGQKAISAIKNPISSPYWYYIHDSTGQVHFATTLKDHEANIDKFLTL